MSQPFDPAYQPPPEPPPSSPGLTQLKIAAIILLVCAPLGMLAGILDGVGRAVIIANPAAAPPMFGMRPAEMMGGIYFFLGVDIATVVFAPVVIIGAIQMLRRRMLNFVRLSAVVAMLPISTCCCCVATLPVGIWALILLSSPDVRQSFT